MWEFFKSVWLISVVFLLCKIRIIDAICPKICSCKNVSENIRVKCGGSEDGKLVNWKHLDFGENASRIIHIDLSKSGLSQIEKGDFSAYINLRRLDVSSNLLEKIDENSFGTDLENVERLRLSNNSIRHIYPGTFDYMLKLKQLDISNNPLVCDCDLVWILAWSFKHSVKLQPTPKCEYPDDFKGTLLKRLKVGQDLHCESPLPSLLELIPNQNQVVFEGDQLILKCRAPRIAIGVPKDSEDLSIRAHVFWGWSQKIPQTNSTEDIIYVNPIQYFSDVHLETKPTTDSGLLNSILKISNLTKKHSGLWDCTLRSQQANLSQAVAIIVISKGTEYCPSTEVTTNKGKFYWPQTIRGKTVHQECVEKSDSNNGFTTYECSHDGTWINLKTDNCVFVSETTRILQQFTKVNFTLTKHNVIQIVRRLHNFTQTNFSNLRDPIDLEFIARAMLMYLEHVQQQDDVSYILLDIVSQLLLLPQHLFYKAQKLYQSGNKLLNTVEVAGANVQTSPLIQRRDGLQVSMLTMPKNLFIDYFNVSMESFSGITCIWLKSDRVSSNGPNTHSFKCTASNDTYPIFENYVDAAIQIPFNMHVDDKQKNLRLMVAIFRNANLFTHMEYNDTLLTEELTSAVIGTKIEDDTSMKSLNIELSDQISVILRMRPYHNDISAPVPAWWDSESNSWNKQHCQKLYMHRGLLMFTCSHLGYYGLIQKTKFLNDFVSENSGATFHFAPITIYVGCAVLFICSWVNIVTFVVYKHVIRINRQQRHSLINTCLAVSMLCLMFTLGIQQTERFNICRVVGVLIHYLTLCVLLWLCVSLSTMYKRLSKTHRVVIESEMIPKDVRFKKPILGIYLVGWGIGMIICGISSAININEYASYSYCFLHHRTALNALIVPAIILLVFLGILCLCIYCHLNRKAVNLIQSNQFSDNTQATENIDLEWLDSAHRINTKYNNIDHYKSLTLSSPLSSIVDDYEISNIAHLRAYIVFLLLFVFAWLSAAAFIVQFVEEKTTNSSSHLCLYGSTFAICCSLLGCFMLVFYTLSRNDIRNAWSRGKCCHEEHQYTSKDLDDSYMGGKYLSPTTTNVIKTACKTNNSVSRSNSQCSSRYRANSVRSIKSNERSARNVDGNGFTQQLLNSRGTTSSPTVLINNQHCGSNNLNSSFNHDIPSADIFYNPNQINVARKFFKKQKRLAKRNNFELQRQVDRIGYMPDNLSDVSSSLRSEHHVYSKRHNAMTLLSGGSKVNNTNIYYKSDFAGRERSITKAECEHIVTSNAVHPVSDSQCHVLANIYTNIPETFAPQHEIIKMRSSGNCVKSFLVDLAEHEEVEVNSVHSQGEHVLYENTSANANSFTVNPISETDSQTFELSAPTSFLEYCEVETIKNIGLAKRSSPTNNTRYCDKNRAEIILSPNQQNNENHICNSLQIINCINADDIFPSTKVTSTQKQHQQSKSLNNLVDLYDSPKYDSNQQLHSTSNNCVANVADDKFEDSNAACLEMYSKKVRRSFKCNLNGFESNTAYILSDSRSFSISPTNESDLNYQNSEISIRSHDLYAPQIDNELNLTLTDDFPYQSSNTSETGDILNDFDEEFIHTLGDLELSNEAEIQGATIDELYEAIKRCSPIVTSVTSQNSTKANVLTEVRDNAHKTDSKPNQRTGSEKSYKDPSNAPEDDSSQSSIISYIHS